MPLPSVLILDCAGTTLTAEEKRFFATAQPYGFILFARNCESPAQVKRLTGEMKDAVGRADVPILIDQEGGRVTRLKPPQFRACPSAGSLAALGSQAAKAIYLNARLIAHELVSLGINVDCAPVADLLIAGAHDIIGDRAYGADADTVAHLAGEMARGLAEGGVVPVVKHMPGHGRARADSHHALPQVDTPLPELERTDFAAFKKLKALPMGMTAHVVYTALDAKRMVTVSPAAIGYIRRNIGFEGLLMSDDITMKAMQGSYVDRMKAALLAGCDVILFCNQPLAEQQKLAEHAPHLAELVRQRSALAFAQVKHDAPFDAREAEAQLAGMLRQAA